MSSVVIPGMNAIPDWLNVKAYGAKGTNSGNDSTGIQAAVDACPVGGVVYIPAGVYRLVTPITLKANITIKGALGSRYQQYSGILASGGAHIKPLSGSFVGSALFQATDASGWRMEDMILYGLGSQDTQGVTDTSSTPISGIHATGECKGVRLSQMQIVGMSGDGIRTEATSNGWAGGWDIDRCYVTSNYGHGLNAMNTDSVATYCFSDSKIFNSEFSISTNDGIHLDNCVTNLSMSCVWFCWNHGNGLYISGHHSGNISLTEIATDSNTLNGVYLKCAEVAPNNAPAPRIIKINGYISSRDGRNTTQAQGSYAGLRIEGEGTSGMHVPVLVSNMSCHVSDDDADTWMNRPAYGVYCVNASNVIITGSYLAATNKPTHVSNSTVSALATVNSFATVDYATGAVTYNTAAT